MRAWYAGLSWRGEKFKQIPVDLFSGLARTNLEYREYFSGHATPYWQRPPTELQIPFQFAVVALFGVVAALIVVGVRGTVKRALKASAMSMAHRSPPAALQARDKLCCHPQRVEKMLRNDGVQITHKPWQDVCALCQVDRDRLAQIFGPAVVALYAERHDIDRSYLDPKSALCWCAACSLQLRMRHCYRSHGVISKKMHCTPAQTLFALYRCHVALNRTFNP